MLSGTGWPNFGGGGGSFDIDTVRTRLLGGSGGLMDSSGALDADALDAYTWR